MKAEVQKWLCAQVKTFCWWYYNVTTLGKYINIRIFVFSVFSIFNIVSWFCCWGNPNFFSQLFQSANQRPYTAFEDSTLIVYSTLCLYHFGVCVLGGGVFQNPAIGVLVEYPTAPFFLISTAPSSLTSHCTVIFNRLKKCRFCFEEHSHMFFLSLHSGWSSL